MQIHLYDSAAQVGQAAATLIAAQIIAKPDSVLGLATGSQALYDWLDENPGVIALPDPSEL